MLGDAVFYIVERTRFVWYNSKYFKTENAINNHGLLSIIDHGLRLKSLKSGLGMWHWRRDLEARNTRALTPSSLSQIEYHNVQSYNKAPLDVQPNQQRCNRNSLKTTRKVSNSPVSILLQIAAEGHSRVKDPPRHKHMWGSSGLVYAGNAGNISSACICGGHH